MFLKILYSLNLFLCMKPLSSKGLECILVPFLNHTVTQLFNWTVYDDKRTPVDHYDHTETAISILDACIRLFSLNINTYFVLLISTSASCLL